ncbi:hypothetical protein [Actinoplanes xinjiangensis]|uniref:Uncharacterized protein n=1 Tax=Actinoplanes xinjiangensis TaxID=512350 RepID=A0A316FFT1_9ACTN|nr:hypothetical protein [Actinoplanes xinjiangensis]PWK47768.1 hypothetical protein BC793_107378 [Actinoplanes xinjiangensis]GIF39298.1 hypothetical protein Axi01nite_36090 [Actinoplanes xinjiangensis]
MKVRGLPRRRLLVAVLGAAVTVGMTASCTGPSGDTDPPGPSPSPDPSMLQDDLADGIAVEDRGFSTFPVPGGSDTGRIIGAAAVIRNTTDRPMRVHVRYRFVDATGHGWRSDELDDWAAVVSAGWAYLPPGQSVELGDGEQIDAAEAARVARIVLYVNGEGTPTTKASVLLRAKIDKLLPRPAGGGWDYVSFDVESSLYRFREPNYVMVFRSPDGRLIGGWFVDRAHWVDIEKSLPEGETDEYRSGTSRHTLPTLLPPGIRPGDVTMYLWP